MQALRISNIKERKSNRYLFLGGGEGFLSVCMQLTPAAHLGGSPVFCFFHIAALGTGHVNPGFLAKCSDMINKLTPCASSVSCSIFFCHTAWRPRPSATKVQLMPNCSTPFMKYIKY
jgi:hypothetical protein